MVRALPARRRVRGPDRSTRRPSVADSPGRRCARCGRRRQPHGFNIGLNLGTWPAGRWPTTCTSTSCRGGGATPTSSPSLAQTKVLPQLLADTRDLLAAAWRDADAAVTRAAPSVLYDGACGFCTRSDRVALERLADRRRLCAVPVGRPGGVRRERRRGRQSRAPGGPLAAASSTVRAAVARCSCAGRCLGIARPAAARAAASRLAAAATDWSGSSPRGRLPGSTPALAPPARRPRRAPRTADSPARSGVRR